MKKFAFKITIEAQDEAEAKQLAQSLQQATTAVDNVTMSRLLAAVVKKPSLAKSALMFIK